MCKWIDPVQARLGGLLRRLESLESLIRTLQAKQNPSQRRFAGNCLVDARKQQKHSDKLTTMLGGMEMMEPSQRTSPRLCRRGMQTQNFDDCEFDVLLYKRGPNPGDHCFLVPRLIAGLTGRAREHLRMAGDLDRFAVDGGLEQFLEYLKTKMGISRPQGGGMAIQEVSRSTSTKSNVRGVRSTTSWVNRSDDALMDMRKKLPTAPCVNSSDTTMIPPQIQGRLILHRAR